MDLINPIPQFEVFVCRIKPSGFLLDKCRQLTQGKDSSKRVSAKDTMDFIGVHSIYNYNFVCFRGNGHYFLHNWFSNNIVGANINNNVLIII